MTDNSWGQRFSLIIFAILMGALVCYGLVGLVRGKISLPARREPSSLVQYEGWAGRVIALLVIGFGLAALAGAWYLLQGM